MRAIENLFKISPPLLPPVLHRARLLAHLERNKGKKLIVILGQAAQGKTTLAASYTRNSNVPTAWTNLDRGDSDPFNFFTLLVHSLQRLLQGADFSRLLSYPYPSANMDLRSQVPLFREWVLALLEIIEPPIQIVVDGLERLDENAPAFQFLQIFLDQAPADLCLILLTRETPPLHLDFQQLNMSPNALILTNEELAFTADEIQEYFQKLQGILLPIEQLIKISLITEGWAGGLILLAECLHLLKKGSKKKNLFKDIPGLFKEEVFQYLAKEIFSSQSERMQEFLIKSSVIEIIEPGFMNDFTGMEDSGKILQAMVRRNLFVHSVCDQGDRWLFRYHPLLRDFLRAKLETEVSLEERLALSRTAGQLCEKRGEFAEAVKLYLEAKAYSQAASLIERIGLDLLPRGRKGDLAQKIKALPETLVQKSPWLLFHLAVSKRFTEVKNNICLLEKAFSGFKRNGEMRGQILSLAYLIENLIHGGHYSIAIDSLIRQGEKILSSLKPEQFPYERATLWLQMGLANIQVEGDIGTGTAYCQEAYLIAKQGKDINLQLNALAFLVLGYAVLGEFEAAEEACRTSEQISRKSDYPELQAVHLLARSVLCLNSGDLAGAETHVGKLQSAIEEYGLLYMYPMALSVRGFLKINRQHFRQAEDCGKQLLNTAKTLDNFFLGGLANVLIGQCRYHKGEMIPAKEATQKGMEIFSSKEGRSNYHFHRAKQLMGLICCHQGNYRRAETELQESLAYFTEHSNSLAMAGTHLALALLHRRRGRDDDAAFHLQAGFRIAAENKFEHFLVLSPQDLLRACLLALELPEEGEGGDYPDHLLSTRLGSIAGEELKKIQDRQNPKMKEKIWKIRRKIHRAKIPCLRIETLGRLRIYRGSAPMEEKDWDRNQPRQLLSAILSHRTPNVAKDVLMEHLWPEADSLSTDKNFKTTLQRLRKSLEPLVTEEFGSSYVHLHDGFVSLDSELCRVDADLFLYLIKNGAEKEKKENPQAALPFYTKAAELYKGDFLPEENYVPWVEGKREFLKENYLDALRWLARYYENHARSKKAILFHQKIIQEDPLAEESYQNLMKLFTNLGMRNEALRTYENCKKVMQTNFENSPDPFTVALYKKILEKAQPSGDLNL